MFPTMENSVQARSPRSPSHNVELQLLPSSRIRRTSHRSIPAGEMTHSRHLPAGFYGLIESFAR